MRRREFEAPGWPDRLATAGVGGLLGGLFGLLAAHVLLPVLAPVIVCFLAPMLAVCPSLILLIACRHVVGCLVGGVVGAAWLLALSRSSRTGASVHRPASLDRGGAR